MSKHLKYDLVVACALAGALFAAPDARAQEGFTLQPYEPPPPPDHFFSAPDANAEGHLSPAGQLVGHYAYKPLLTRTNPSTGREVELLSSQLYVFLGGSVAFYDRFLAAIDIPFALAQDSDPRLDAGAAFGDIRLSGRFAAFHFDYVDLGLQLDFWLPTGSEDNLTGDGTPRSLPRAVASGRIDALIYSANVGYLIRDREQDASLHVGSAFVFGLAAGLLLFDDWVQVGGELSGHSVIGGGASFFDELTTPVYALLGAKLRYRGFAFGVGGGPSLSEAPGNSPRVLLTVAYAPPARSEATVTTSP